MPEFIPSDYQKKVFDWIHVEQGNAIVNAVAGAGKTTTLVEATKIIPSKNLIFVAFNNHIVDTLKSRLPYKSLCKTTHGIGKYCLHRRLGDHIDVDDLKYKKLCRHAASEYAKELLAEYEAKLQWSSTLNDDTIEKLEEPPVTQEIEVQIEKLIQLSMFTLTPLNDLNAIEQLVEHFGIEQFIDDRKAAEIAQGIIDYGEEISAEERRIDFIDMIWLPYKWNLKPSKFDWILVDEAQDLNALQVNLLMKMVGPNSRMIFVGDPRQAIYGFTGADSESFYKIKKLVNAKEHPLSICYRCPTQIVDLAKSIVPTIEAAPNAAVGQINNIKEDQLISETQLGDLIICRFTEPLVRHCIRLIRHRKPAIVKGKDIGLSLISIVEAVEKVKFFNFLDFITFLNYYKKERIERLKSKFDAAQQIENFNDQVSSIEAIYNGFPGLESSESLKMKIEELFGDRKNVITLSTIHKAKGIENDRVFILYYEKLPHTWEKQLDWQYEQELNLKYVAITRAMKELIMVSEVPGMRPQKN